MRQRRCHHKGPAMRRPNPWGRSAALTLALVLGLAALVMWLNLRGDPDPGLSPGRQDAAMIARGAYLARAGNCMACHTERGGVPYAGGRPIDTPFGIVYAGNLTPDRDTGIGQWSADDFWRALRNGRSRDGRLLYPAFPYPNYTLMQREDADALFAFLQNQAAVRQPNRDHQLRWPFSTQTALALWRALYFTPGGFRPQAEQGPIWNRGAYLVQGLGHCSACHAERNALGANSPLDLAGGLIPMQNWYAPSLTDRSEAGVMDWPLEEIVSLLGTGTSSRGSAHGPMAEVVLHSTQHLSADDLQAMATFLKGLPPARRHAIPSGALAKPNAAGAALYEKHCLQCHGEQGQGVAGAYPALAGNRAVSLEPAVNLVQIVMHGAYPPATRGNPQPFGMPPYLMDFSETEIADLLNHLRSSWGHRASAITALDVQLAREGRTR